MINISTVNQTAATMWTFGDGSMLKEISANTMILLMSSIKNSVMMQALFKAYNWISVPITKR